MTDESLFDPGPLVAPADYNGKYGYRRVLYEMARRGEAMTVPEIVDATALRGRVAKIISMAKGNGHVRIAGERDDLYAYAITVAGLDWLNAAAKRGK